MSSLTQRLRALTPAVLNAMRRGVEKESLRVRPDGALALTPHPLALGSALTHPHITTDFSESQLELITGVHANAEGCLEELGEIHRMVIRNIGEEMLWGASMPCLLPAEAQIPLGRYGDSNVGRAKTVYRTGLGHRYGRRMQTISGIHYNFSLPLEDPNRQYFALIRNFRRHSWLLLFLFGASPAVCASFVAGRSHELQVLKEGSLYLPHATSLRMGRLGYQSDAQASLAVSYNNLENYGASLQDALTRPYPPYEAIGVRGPEGEYRQLGTTLLQIENEFYGTIRPKRVILQGERPLHALRERGVEYVEVRCMDLDPFSPTGIEAPVMRLLDVFLLHCLLSDSPPDTAEEIAALARNQHRVAARGREPGLELERNGKGVALAEWAGRLLEEFEPIAAALDGAHGGASHRDALAGAVAALADPSRLPSARMLDEMQRHHDNSCLRFAIARSAAHRDELLRQPLAPEVEARFMRLARDSVAEQVQIEAQDSIPFEEFRQNYLDPARLGLQPARRGATKVLER